MDKRGKVKRCIVNMDATDEAVKVGQSMINAYSSHSSQKFEGLMECPSGSVTRRKQWNTARNGMKIGEADNKIGRTCFSDSVSSPHIMDASIENSKRATRNSGYHDEHPAKKLRSNVSLCLNSMSSNTIEAAILDLEELANRIKWLRNLLNLGVPSSGARHPSWEFSQHHSPCN